MFFVTKHAKFILKERYIKFSSGNKKYVQLYRCVHGLCDIVVAEEVSNKLKSFAFSLFANYLTRSNNACLNTSITSSYTCAANPRSLRALEIILNNYRSYKFDYVRSIA